MSKVLGDLLIHSRTYGQAIGRSSGRRVCSAEITSPALSCKPSLDSHGALAAALMTLLYSPCIQ